MRDRPEELDVVEVTAAQTAAICLTMLANAKRYAMTRLPMCAPAGGRCVDHADLESALARCLDRGWTRSTSGDRRDTSRSRPAIMPRACSRWHCCAKGGRFGSPLHFPLRGMHG